MRKVLLGTTALVAGGMFAAGAVQAEEMMADPISVGVGGYYRAAMGFVGGDDAAGEPMNNAHSTLLGQDVELTVSGETTLDNGMTVGLVIQIEGGEGGSANETAGPTLDERWLYFKGGFGQIRIGAVESARQQFTNFAPHGASNFGVNTPFFNFVPAGYIATYNDGIGAEDSIKLVYLSPSFNGFQFGLSYAPDDREASQYPQFTGARSNNRPQPATVWVVRTRDRSGALDGNVALATAAPAISSDILWSNAGSAGQEYAEQLAVGAAYAQSFEGVNIRLAAGYESYEAEINQGASCPGSSPLRNCKPESVHFGATVGMGDISVGGGWLQTDTSNTLQRTDYEVGASWATGGPLVLGAVMGKRTSETVSGRDTEVDRYALNGSLALGPGVDLQAQIDTGSLDEGRSNDWVQFMIGTAVTF